jgi:hypothetical protein
METKEQRPEQAEHCKQARRLERHTRGPLGTLIALLGYTLMDFVAFFRALLVVRQTFVWSAPNAYFDRTKQM